MLSSDRNASQASLTVSSSDNTPSLSLSLSLEQITFESRKYSCSVELKRVLGFPLGSSLEDYCFGVGHTKHTPPMPIEKLKNFKKSVQDTLRSARARATFWRRSIIELDRYEEAIRSTKRQKTYLLSNGRYGQTNILTMGDHSICNRPSNLSEKVEDKTKSGGLEMKRHLRTSMLDTRTTDIPGHAVIVDNGRCMVKCGVGDDSNEEKIPRLPTGGGGWDKTRKRKLSLGAAVNRVIVRKRNVKQSVCANQSAETRLQPLEAQGFRSRALSRIVGSHNLVKSHLATPSREESRIEIEGVTPLRDSSITTKEEIVVEGKNKTDIREHQAVSSSSTVKRKISRTQRTCSFTVFDSSDFHYSCGADGSSEQSINTIKSLPLSVANSNNCPMSSTVSVSKMSRLVGQRPPSILPTRRADLVPPVSNTDGVPQVFLKSEDGARPSCGSLLVGSVDASNPKGKMEPANFSSPPASSECEESGRREHNPNVKRTDATGAVDNASVKAAMSIYPTRKENVLVKGGTRNSVENRGKMSLAKLSVTPSMENTETLLANRPLQSARRSSDKDGKSKSSCPPSKKQMIRKTSSRSAHVLNSCFPDNGGDLDDLDELLVAAESARKASYRACSSLFWKKMEHYFSSITSHDETYLKHQLDFAEALSGSLYQMPREENSDVVDLKLQQDAIYSAGKQESPANQESNGSAAICGGSGVTKTITAAPSLYQRVLSALIEVDESKQTAIQNEGRTDFQCASDDSHCDSCNYNDFEPENNDRIASVDNNYESMDRDKMDPQIESKVDQQVHKNRLLDKNSSDKSVSSNTDSNRSVCSTVCNSEHWQADDGLSYYAGLVPPILHNDPGSSLDASPVSSSDSNYHMLPLDDKILLELHSIGLYPAAMPQLAEGEKTIDEDIIELQAGLFQQAERTKKNIGKIYEAIPYVKDAEKRNMEQVGMSKLIEMAYKKRMASRQSDSSKRVVRKVSKQVALAFAERTLARCRKFEKMGRGCFSEAALQNIMFPTVACDSDNPVKRVDTASANSRHKRSFNHNLYLIGSGYLNKQQYASNSHEPILIKGMKREVLLNDVASASSGALSVGSVKGKRTERTKDQTTKLTNTYVPGIDHLLVGSSHGVPKSKEKPMQIASYLLPLDDTPESRFMEPTQASNEPPHASSLPVAIASHVIRRNEEQHNEEKGKDFANHSAEQLAELGSFQHEDYTSLLDFDVDGLQDQDLLGLEIPMDDLSDVHLFM